jgi:hypothetical protein
MRGADTVKRCSELNMSQAQPDNPEPLLLLLHVRVQVLLCP